jgi:hypothetical protein
VAMMISVRSAIATAVSISLPPAPTVGTDSARQKNLPRWDVPDATTLTPRPRSGSRGRFRVAPPRPCNGTGLQPQPGLLGPPGRRHLLRRQPPGLRRSRVPRPAPLL